jgi:hypothetical protein
MGQTKVVPTFHVALNDTEKAESLHFIETNMRKSFHCEPPPTKGLTCFVRIDDEIAGTLVLQGSTQDALFPAEEHYSFSTINTPFPFDRTRIVQASRWLAIKKGITYTLVRGAFTLAYELGKQFVLIEAKPYSTKRLAELGIDCIAIPNAALLIDIVRATIGEDGMAYFIEPPQPTLYMISIKQALAL